MKYKEIFVGKVNGKVYNDEAEYRAAAQEALNADNGNVSISSETKRVPIYAARPILPGFENGVNTSNYLDRFSIENIDKIIGNFEKSKTELIDFYSEEDETEQAIARNNLKKALNNIEAFAFKKKGQVDRLTSNINKLMEDVNKTRNIIKYNEKFHSFYKDIEDSYNKITPDKLVENESVSPTCCNSTSSNQQNKNNSQYLDSLIDEFKQLNDAWNELVKIF